MFLIFALPKVPPALNCYRCLFFPWRLRNMTVWCLKVAAVGQRCEVVRVHTWNSSSHAKFAISSLPSFFFLSFLKQCISN